MHYQMTTFIWFFWQAAMSFSDRILQKLPQCIKSKGVALKPGEQQQNRGVTGEWVGWAIAHPVFGSVEGAAGKQRRGVPHY